MSKNEIQHQPLTTSDTNTNPQSVPSLEDMRKQMPENLPDRKPLQMKTCFESSPTLEMKEWKSQHKSFFLKILTQIKTLLGNLTLSLAMLCLTVQCLEPHS